ncbi:MAG: HAD family hydrolase [Acidobacteria bacterium]|nr:HAD family hydrolase [Acidobacteriota bacterium]
MKELINNQGPQKFQAIFLDLFNTVLHLDYSVLDEVDFEGQKIRTTSWFVYQKLRGAKDVPFTYETFLEHFLASQQMITEMRDLDLREYPSLERFRILQSRLRMGDPDAAQFMVDAHMAKISEMIRLPEENKRVFDQISHFPLVLASNFDHGLTVRRALAHFGLIHYFKTVIISDEIGWRKPAPQFFQIAQERSGYKAADSLYVGDDAHADVLGAVRAGFQTVWLVQDHATPPVAPRWRIKKLSDLVELLV